MPLCDLKTKKDVVENALTLLGWAATQSSKGLSIAAVDEERKIYKEVVTTALEGAKNSSARLNAATTENISDTSNRATDRMNQNNTGKIISA